MNYQFDDFTLQTPGSFVSSPQLTEDVGGLFLDGDWEAPQLASECAQRNYELMKYGSWGAPQSPGGGHNPQFLHPRNRDLIPWSAPGMYKEGFAGGPGPWRPSRADPNHPGGRHPALPSMLWNQNDKNGRCHDAAAARERAIGAASGYRFPLPKPSPTLCGPVYRGYTLPPPPAPYPYWAGPGMALMGGATWGAPQDTTFTWQHALLLLIFVILVALLMRFGDQEGPQVLLMVPPNSGPSRKDPAPKPE